MKQKTNASTIINISLPLFAIFACPNITRQSRYIIGHSLNDTCACTRTEIVERDRTCDNVLMYIYDNTDLYMHVSRKYDIMYIYMYDLCI